MRMRWAHSYLIMAFGGFLAACPRCPDGQTRETIGWITSSDGRAEIVLPPDGADVKVGESALLVNYYCFYPTMKFARVAGHLNPTTHEVTLAFPVNSFPIEGGVGYATDYPLDFVNENRVRVLAACDGYAAPQVLWAQWVTSNGKIKGHIPLQLPGVPDTGIIRGNGYACFENPTNVPVRVVMEWYLPDIKCVASNAHIDPDRNIAGGIKSEPRCAGVSDPPPLHFCRDPMQEPGYQVFCQVCGGSSTTRTTVEYYGWCKDEAREATQNYAANCDIRDGAC